MQPPLTPAQQRVFFWIEDFIADKEISPSVRDIQDGLGYRSPAPVTHHLKSLVRYAYISQEPDTARSIRVLRPSRSIPIMGTIAAHSLVTVFPDEAVELINLCQLPKLAHLSRHELGEHFALRVRGDSMIGALIADGDVVIMRRESNPSEIKDETIVAARVNETTTLKHFYRNGNLITLKPANSRYPEQTIDTSAEEVEIQGVYVGVVRDLI